MKRFFAALFSVLFSIAASGQDLTNVNRFLSAGEYQQALDALDQLSNKSASSEQQLKVDVKRFEALIGLGSLEQAELIRRSLESTQWSSSIEKGSYLVNTGALMLNRGRQDLALEKLEEAYNTFQAANVGSSADAARCLSWLTLTFVASGKYNQAVANGKMALQIRQQLFGGESEEVAASNNDLGLAYSQIDPDQALESYEKALAIYEKLHGSEHPKIAIAKTNIGNLYTQIELFGDAINNLEAASKIWLKLYPEGHPNLGFVYRSLGQTYVKMRNNALALTYFEKALEQYRKAYGQKNPEIASTLNQIAAVRSNQQQYDLALQNIQQALIANIPSFSKSDVGANPPTNEYYNPTVLLFSFMLKAQALEGRHFGKTLRLSDLTRALENLSLCDSLIDDIRHHSSNESDKIALGSLAADVYEDGVRISTALADITASPKKYFERAFYFAEKSKSAVLQESIADSQAKSFAGIPQELIDQEANLKSGIAFLTQRLGQGPPPTEEKYLRESLFALNAEYNSFTKKLEHDYPNYYNLKYNNSFPTVSQLQSQLQAKQAIVSYFIAEKSGRMYQFIITNKKFKAYDLTLPANFDRLTKGFNNGILYRNFDTYKLTSHALQPVLTPRVPKGTTELTIIPSGRMSTLPLEALATKLGDDFATTSFLVSKYAIGYEFSAGLIAQKKRGTSIAEPSIFLCAPVEFPEQDRLASLPGTEKEVSDISSLFGTRAQVYKFQQANEAQVKLKDISKYNYIHFATHGIVDESAPELSRIFLNEAADEDGNLFAGEIYNLNLNADLAVLSACQTGLGKISKGEGVIGLSRALVYAGARNLVVSFWSVADQSTSELMTDFYKNLLNSPNGDFRQALQKAKTKMIQASEFHDPFYWAAFVLIGQ